ncbi:type I restriction-modification system endonuclease, R subunit [Mycoplasma haemofelis str. Langford 1]|uniref:Type I restriction enzyme endonuclease subunit n=1 Tax=Mycoplasma haemofelis (strain Langford 1) TaxID=941640 RepID=E8ZHV7_MYCHL|nr:type I restriction endonuclease subunit R [Mycoplasma haemofelis]CBY92728.1 type I restriction-modification system endonuclease, R subunit [Mycoplasma haemofelis str. Langford 1]
MLGGQDSERRRGWCTGADLEKELIGYLKALGYVYLDVKNEGDVFNNLREQIQRLNSHKGVVFTDSEWNRFFNECICKAGEEPLDKLKKIQGNGWKQSLVRDDGSTENIQLIDKRNLYNNKLQFINRYSNSIEAGGDITILLNGLPMVHIELRKSSKFIESIFSGARLYNPNNFMGKSGLFDFVEMFIISNGLETKYYSSTTRRNFLKDYNSKTVDILTATSNSFMFTSYWSNEANETYVDLSDFAKTFLEKQNLLEMIINFCVLDSNGVLKIMRPYQVHAVKKIIHRIKNSSERGILGRRESGGYIWHATGSGKTLTSFKASRLAAQIPEVDTVLFVVDRKDLDYQTQREYDNFESGSAKGIKSVNDLKDALSKTDQKIIITTIQKLHRYVKKYKSKEREVFKKHIVLIFDECHRSQFGEMHLEINKAFRNSHIFGFTGTPIFQDKDILKVNTTDHYFGDELHRYILTNAMQDKNVLEFKVDYFKSKGDCSEVVKYILEKFDSKTLRPEFSNDLNDKRNRGYNSILCVDSIAKAISYYREFKKQLKEVEPHKKLDVFAIYSAQEQNDNFDVDDGSSGNPDVEGMSPSQLACLEDIIEDYNSRFNTSYSTSPNSFNSYYQDLSKRTKSKEIDILIVVNMFLTGFDAPTCNTLWVDKVLKRHGLIQAFSRTNRICRNTKISGNIVCFKGDAEPFVQEAFSVYGGGDPSLMMVPTFEQKYEEYEKAFSKLNTYEGRDINSFTREEALEYARAVADFLKLTRELGTYDDFKGKELVSDEELRKYQSNYIDLREKFEDTGDTDKLGGGEEGSNDAEEEFNSALEFIKQTEISLEYIIDLIITNTAWQDMNSNEKLEEHRAKINSMIGSTTYLRSKKKIINDFIDDVEEKTEESFKNFIKKRLEEDVDALVIKESIDKDATRDFIARAFRNNQFEEAGVEIENVVPPSRLNRQAFLDKQGRVLTELRSIYDKFRGLTRFDFDFDSWIL